MKTTSERTISKLLRVVLIYALTATFDVKPFFGTGRLSVFGTIFVEAAKPRIGPRSNNQPTESHQSSQAQRVRSSMIHRRLAHKHQKIKKWRLKDNERQLHHQRNHGSRLTFQPPTMQRIANWFHDASSQLFDSDGSIRAMLREEFNHDFVGMTNPTIQTASDAMNADTVSCGESSKSNQQVMTKEHNYWWPSFLNPYVCSSKSDWRVRTYRRRIGFGQDCYQRVRDAALDWEFHEKESNDSSVSRLGMMAIPAVSTLSESPSVLPRRKMLSRPFVALPLSTSSDRNDNPWQKQLHTTSSVRQIWSGPGGQKFVTFSGMQMKLGCFRLPRLYSVNPVKVVYELVDQRGSGVTYTSTAYATMKGHMLQGEERVTVAMRDSDNQAVDVEIVSVSRAAPSLKSQLIWKLPFVGRMQQEFFETQLDSLERIANN